MIEILLVDDESYVTESLAQTIPWQDIGVAQVYQAASGAVALQIMEEQNIDILVTDIRMPEMDGLKLIEAVQDRWSNIRCILLTGYSDFEYAKKAVKLQVSDYILKPVNDDEFVNSVMNTIEALKDEWDQAEKYNQLLYNRKSDFTVLRANLMHDLLLGRRMSHRSLEEKLKQYEIPLQVEDSTVMMLVQLGKTFTAMDQHSMLLMEYAVGNIAEEVFSDRFHIWNCKAPHNCLVLLASLKKDSFEKKETDSDFEGFRAARIRETVQIFRQNVSNYLKGDISVFITEWFEFPEGISNAYRTALSRLILSEKEDSGLIVFLDDQEPSHDTSVKSVELLYKPPTLINLLESKQWQAAEEKMEEVFQDLSGKRYTREHLYEVFLSIMNAYMYTAHKQGQSFYQIGESGYDPLFDPSLIHSFEHVRNWARSMLDKLRTELSVNELHTKSYIIKQVQELVAGDLGHEMSVKTIADKVFLHPVYLSKIYKAETGESLGDYIIRMRMEKAHYLLKNSNKKIYEITSELGYQNPQYFSKMFKKFYGVTPNEFRDQ